MTLYYYLAPVLFCMGLIGTMIKKDLVSKLLCIELMLASVSILLVLFSKLHGVLDGQIQVFFIIVVAAAEVAIGIGLIISLFGSTKSAYAEDISIYSE